uniref:Secreted protein n=1 Tax=Chrysotila carterae TaxID=13221 RepID=A0A7S4FAR0_CHRCT|mmetsp:Transcript_17205/g.36436  ORF Transcript_17205/g.36436 Transcript_17205/m.36436 type:complete len:177 (+) Transcript_17205:132-662(+)
MTIGWLCCEGCFCCLGAAAAVVAARRIRATRAQNASYRALAAADDDIDEYFEEGPYGDDIDGNDVFTLEDDAEDKRDQHHLQTPVTASRNTSSNGGDFSRNPLTPMQPASADAWMAEMNAELAEFDALTGSSTSSPSLRSANAPTMTGTMPSQWQNSLEEELAGHLTSPSCVIPGR